CRGNFSGRRARKVRLDQDDEISGEVAPERVPVEWPRRGHVEDGHVHVRCRLERRVEQRSGGDDRRLATAALDVETTGLDRTGEPIRLIRETEVHALVG